MKRGIVWAVLLSLVGVGGMWSARAASFNSSNFSINGNIGDSAAGGQNSTNYQLTSAAGESIAANSGSKSYKLGQGYISTLENSIQVVTQANGLTAYWPMDDVVSDGTMLDESQNANNGTYSTDSAPFAGKVGSAWSHIGDDQSIAVPHSASLPSGNKMTISAWIYPVSFSSERAIITKWDYDQTYTSNEGAWAFQTGPSFDELRFFVTDGLGDDGSHYVDTTNANLAADTWTHVAMVYDGTLVAADRVKLFVNGTVQTTSITGTISASLHTSTDPVSVGSFPGLGRYWDGALDEMKLYNRTLSANEVVADYEAGNIGVPAGLSLGAIAPGQSQASAFDSIVQTSAAGYTLAINQNNNLTSGGNTIPAVSGSIASPVSWNEGSTKGLGFTLYGTNATTIPGAWSSGSAYAALPAAATSFYTRTGYTGGTKDILNMRLRLDANASQVPGDYTNQMTITGTMIP
ncbi:MAG: LamG domain-containing protein [Patescibacteria group bacterium]